MNRDRMSNAAGQQVTQLGYGAFDAVAQQCAGQGKEELLAGLALAFLYAAQTANAPARTVLTTVENMIRQAEDEDLHQLRALKAYVEGEF